MRTFECGCLWPYLTRSYSYVYPLKWNMYISLAGMGTPGKPQPIVQAAVGSALKPPGIVMPQTESETRKKIVGNLSCACFFSLLKIEHHSQVNLSALSLLVEAAVFVLSWWVGGEWWWWCSLIFWCGAVGVVVSRGSKPPLSMGPVSSEILETSAPGLPGYYWFEALMDISIKMCTCVNALYIFRYFPRVLNTTDLFGQSSSTSSQLGGKCIVETQLLIDTLRYKWDTVLYPIPTAPASFVAVNNVTGHGDAGVCFNMLHSTLSASSVKGQVADRRLRAVPNQIGRSPTTTCYNRIRFKE